MVVPDFGLDFDVKSRIGLLCLSGSYAYGTNTPESDIDHKGFFIQPIDYMISPFKTIEQVGWKTTDDGQTHIGAHLGSISGAPVEGTIYAVDKFVKLASECNPNILETLFGRPEHIMVAGPTASLFLANRQKFLSQRAAKSFTGYAMSQLRRIETHRRWLTNPPKEEPRREAFGLHSIDALSKDQLNAVNAFVRRNMNSMAPWLLDADNQHKEAFWEGVTNMIALYLEEPEKEFDSNRDNWMLVEEEYMEKTSRRMSFDSNFLEYLKLEKQYSQALSDWTKYNHWLKSRNPARAALEIKHGYDTKHGMHLVRLLRMGQEVLSEGKVNVYREDRDELNFIRGGGWSYDKLVEYAADEVDKIYDFVRAGKSPLPKVPPVKELEQLTMDAIAIHEDL